LNESLVVVVRGLIAFFSLLIFTITFFDYVMGITIGSIAASLTTDLTTRALPQWVGLATWTAGVFAMRLVTVLRKSQYQPVTPRDLNLSTSYSGISAELIYDGVIIDQNLSQVNLTRKWLEDDLGRQGINDPEEVFLATLDTSGNLYVDRYRDRVKQPVDPSDYPGIH